MVVKYSDIEKANKSINSMDIKGKQYAMVHERIRAFRMIYPQGFVITKILFDDGEIVKFYAEVGCEDEGVRIVLGTGHAYEVKNSSFINRTSYIENAETSAVGRALAMAGFGVDTSIASADEVSNAIKLQGEKINAEQIEIIKKVYQGDKWDKLLKNQNLKKIEDMPFVNAQSLINKLKQGGKI